jgi:hypothetical protein
MKIRIFGIGREESKTELFSKYEVTDYEDLGVLIADLLSDKWYGVLIEKVDI